MCCDAISPSAPTHGYFPIYGHDGADDEAAAGVGLSPGADEWHVDDPDPAFGRAVNPLSADANVTTNV